MYRHVVDVLRGRGVANTVFVWNIMGYEGWVDYLDALYPGDQYVDWLAYDPYGKSDNKPTMAEVVNTPKPTVGWPGPYAWLTAKAPGKRSCFAEWGFAVDEYTIRERCSWDKPQFCGTGTR